MIEFEVDWVRRFRASWPNKNIAARKNWKPVDEGTSGTVRSECPAYLAGGQIATRGTFRVHGRARTTNSVQINQKEWWRRGESNPRPKSATPRSLHAYLSSVWFARRAQNEQETQPASPMVLAAALRTERPQPAHCVTLLAGPMSKARGSVALN